MLESLKVCNWDKVHFKELCGCLWTDLNNISEPDIFKRIAIIQGLLIDVLENNIIVIDDRPIEYKADTNKMQNDFHKLMGILKLYLEGRIPSAYESFNNWFNQKSFKLTRSSKYPIYDFYRGRKIDNSNVEYSRQDLFHIPYDKRYLIGNYRYSISGTPGLYIAGSVYTCWEELRHPSFTNMSFVHISPLEDFNLFDMRLMRDVSSKKDLKEWTKRLPLNIFSSLKVAKEGPFKPEYIIPQMLLQCIISRQGYNINGVIYNSFRSNPRLLFFNPTKYNPIFDNIVLPATESKQMGYSKDLGEKLWMHNPVSYDDLLVKGCLNKIGKFKSEDYHDTITYDIENACKSGQAFNVETGKVSLNYNSEHGNIYLW